MDRLRHAFESRLRLQSSLAELENTAPERGRRLGDAPPYALGRLTLVMVLILMASGTVLAFFYQPTAQGAAASLARLHSLRSVGGVVHNVHRWSALFLIATTSLHALRAWAAKAYRTPREIGWWLGVVLLLLVAVMGGTGYLLRWDIKAFSLMDLIVTSLSGLPIVGSPLIALLLGGTGQGIIPLNRGYAVHVWFLPAVLVLIILDCICLS